MAWTGISLGRQIARDTAFAFLLAALVFLLLGLGRAPEKAFGCTTNPCSSGVTKVECPFPMTDGTGTASFDVPHGVTPSFEIKDADTGQVYDESHSICANTTMTVAVTS